MSLKKINIYTDGACDPNPGFGGWGFVVVETNFKSKGWKPETTNNEMEMTAVINAIQHAKSEHPDSLVFIHSDSQYCVKGFMMWMHSWKKNGWKKKGGAIKNLWLWKALYELRSNVTLKWVKGHSGNEYNEIADQLASSQIRDLD